MLVEVRGRGRQPAGSGPGIIVDEGQNLPPSLGSRSISSSCGITIVFDNVPYPVVPRRAERLGRDDDQLERKWRLLVQYRFDGALGVAADPFHRHDHTDFHLALGCRLSAVGS